MLLEWKPEDGLEDLKMKALMATLWECEGNKSLAAQKLKVSIVSIKNWIRLYGLNEYIGFPPTAAKRPWTRRRPARRRLAPEDVRQIQKLYGKKGQGHTQLELADRYRVSPTTICRIVRGEY